MQYFVRPAVVRISSLSMICLRWVSIVLALTSRVVAISFVDLPSAISCKTCSSLLVRGRPPAKFFAEMPAASFFSAAAVVIAGLKYIPPLVTDVLQPQALPECNPWADKRKHRPVTLEERNCASHAWTARRLLSPVVEI